MARESMNDAVGRLLTDGAFLRRFRRNPERALRRYDLTETEIEAIKRGDARELLALGLDPAYVWPKAQAAALEPWLYLNARRLAPAAFLAAALALLAAPTARSAREGPPGRPGPPGRVRALERLTRVAGRRRTGLTRAFVRAARHDAAPPGLFRAVERTDATGVLRAISRIAPPEEPPVD
jgi:hypothetical protein